jgi:protocatechuate 3,4-dioxygenase alpha subunit
VNEGAAAHPAPTPSQTIGPFFRFGTEWLAGRPSPPAGARRRLEGTVRDGAGEPVPDAMVEIYSAGAGGSYGAGRQGFGRDLTDEAGRYRFDLEKPGATGDGQAPHLEVTVFARGLLQRLYTRVYFPDENAANAADPLLASVPDPHRAATLIARPGDSGDTLRFDICLQGPEETVFLAW